MTPGDCGPVLLRDAQAADIPTLVTLDAQLFDHDAWSERTWWEEFGQRPKREYVVAQPDPTGDARVDTEILGYAGIDVNGTTADVMTIAVSPTAQGRGIGRLLLDELIARSVRRGADALMLEVRADNDPAIRLYERSGFDRLTVRRRYYQPGDIDAIIMRKLLTEKL